MELKNNLNRIVIEIKISPVLLDSLRLNMDFRLRGSVLESSLLDSEVSSILNEKYIILLAATYSNLNFVDLTGLKVNSLEVMAIMTVMTVTLIIIGYELSRRRHMMRYFIAPARNH